MNPRLSKTIAELQLFMSNSEDVATSTVENQAQVTKLVDQIAAFRLGRKLDKRGDRMAWFTCRDQAQLIQDLDCSRSQEAMFEDMTLSLRVKTELEEGTKARSLDLFAKPNTDSIHSIGHHLMGLLATRPEAGELGTDKIYLFKSPGPLLPGTQEFTDIQTIIGHFSQR